MKQAMTYIPGTITRGVKTAFLILFMCTLCFFSAPLVVRASTFDLTTSLDPSGVITVMNPAGEALTLTGSISGLGKVVNSSVGPLFMAGINPYSGGTDLNSGVVGISNALGLGTGSLYFNGGTFQASSAMSLSYPSIALLSGGGTFDVNGYDTVMSASVTGTGSFAVTNSSVTVGSLTLVGAADGGSVSFVGGSLDVYSSLFGVKGDSTTVIGGNGGNGYMNVTGRVYVDPSTVTVAGGNGADNASGDGGVGGAAGVTVGSLNVLGDVGGSSLFEVLGGNGGNATGATGNGGNGGDATVVSSGAVSMDDGDLMVTGGAAGNGNSSNGINGRGGNASVSIGSDLTVNNGSNLTLVGGSSSAARGTNGDGGSADLAVSGSMTVASSDVSVGGGKGGGRIYGRGGDASVSIGSALTTTDTTFDVVGGNGTSGYDASGFLAGNGGSADLMAVGAVSLASSTLKVLGGAGGSGYSSGGTQGTGGNASVSFSSSLTLDNATTMSLVAGNGGSETYNGYGGNGGNAAMSVDSDLTMSNGSSLGLVAGIGGTGNYGFGSAGSSSLFVSGLLSMDSSALDLEGANGFGISGNAGGYDHYYGGAGGTGGTGRVGGLAVMEVAGDMSLVSSTLNIHGGDSVGGVGGVGGGAYYYAGNGGSGGAGGLGGSATLSVTRNVSLVSSDLNVRGGDSVGGAGGAGGSAYYFGGDGGAGGVGAGGSAVLTVGGNVSLLSSALNVTGGDSTGGVGGPGGISSDWYVLNGSGGASGAAGTRGSADLTVAGALSADNSSVSVNGSTASVSLGSAVMSNGSSLDVLGDVSADLMAANDFVLASSWANVAAVTATASLGAASVSASSFNIHGVDSADLTVSGALTVADGSVSVGGANASVSLGSASVSASSLYVNGVDSADLTVSGALTVADGSVSVGATDASVSLGSASVSASSFQVNGVDSADLTVANDFVMASSWANVGALAASVSLGSASLSGASTFTLVGDDSVDLTVANGLTLVGASQVTVGAGSGLNNDSGDAENGTGATASVGSLSMVGDQDDETTSSLVMRGGDGGSATTVTYVVCEGVPVTVGRAGNGGSVSMAVTGTASMDYSDLTVSGGNGGSSDVADAGNSGNAAVSVGSGLSLTNASYLMLLGGIGGDASYGYDEYNEEADDSQVLGGVGGNGGAALLMVAGAVTIDSSSMGLTGSNGGNSVLGDAGQGGDASLSVGSDMTLTNASLDLRSGNGGSADRAIDDNGDEVGGRGGNAGLASLTVAGLLSVEQSAVSVSAGEGGSGAMGSDGNDGAASVSVGSLSMSNASTLSVLGGASSLVVSGAASLDASGVIAYGDTASVSMGSLLMNGSTMEAVGNTASVAVTGAVSMDTSYVMVQGEDASVSVGSLSMVDESNLYVTGTTASLVSAGPVSLDVAMIGVNGQSASVSVGSLSVVHFGYVDVSGETASLASAGPVSVDDATVGVYGRDASVSVGSDLFVMNGGGVSVWGDTASLFVGGQMVMDGGFVDVEAGSGGLELFAISTESPTPTPIRSASVSAGSMSLLNGSEAFVVGDNATLVSNGQMLVDNSRLLLSTFGGPSPAKVSLMALAPSTATATPTVGAVSVSVGSLSVVDGSLMDMVGDTVSLVSSGPVSVDDASLHVDASSDAFVSVGSLALVNGGTLGMSGTSTTLVSAGAVSMDAAAAYLSGLSASASLGGLTMRNGSSLGIDGFEAALTSGGVVSLDASELSVSGVSAAMTVGSLTEANGSTLNVSGTLDASLVSSGAVTLTSSSASVSADIARASLDSLSLVDGGSSLAVVGTTGSSLYVGGLFGLGSVTVTGDAATLQVASGDFSGSLGGAVGLEKVGTTDSILFLRGINNYSEATTVTSGWLAVDTDATLGLSNAVTVGEDGVLAFINAKDASALTIVNSGLVQFENETSAGDAQIDNLGSVVFRDGSLASAVTVMGETGSWTVFRDLADGGNSVFNMAVSSLFDISGSTNGVTVGSIDGAGDILLGSKNLGLGVNDTDMTLSGVIWDGGLSGGVSGSLTKLGLGTLTLDGDNNFTGGTTLVDGRLVVGSTRALGRGDATLVGGELSAGAGNHLIFVEGDYLQTAPATLALGLGGTLAEDFDRLLANGSVSLDGTLAVSNGTFANGFRPLIGDGFYVVASQGDLTGEFDAITDTYADTRLYPVYFPHELLLETMPTSFTDLSKTVNQTSVATMLDKIYDDRSQAVTYLLAGLGTLRASEYAKAYDQIAPESLASMFTVSHRIAGAQASALENHMAGLMSARGGFSARLAGIESVRFAGNLPAEVELEMARHSSRLNGARWGGFLSGDRTSLTVDGDGNGEGYEATFGGLTAAGVDYQISHKLALGVLFGYQGASVSADGGSRLTIRGGQAGFYGLFKSRGFYSQAMGVFGKNDYDSQRASFGGVASGKTDGTMLSGQFGLGYRYETGKWAMGPTAGIQYTNVKVDAFTETGSLSPEAFGEQEGHSLAAQLGARVGGKFDMGRSMSLVPALRAAWVKELDYEGGDITSSIGNQAFTVQGSRIGQSGFQTEASLGLQWKSGFNLSVQYRKDFGRDHFDAQTLGGQVHFKL